LRNHPTRNLITQTWGIGAPEPSVRSVPLAHRDWLLLCSDGLTDELEDDAIADILRRYSDPDAAADALIAGALAHGGRDNISVVIVEYDGPDGTSMALRNAAARLRWLGLIGALIVLVLAAWLLRVATPP
jgi:serine/threonine protein phosphatase PrpC